MFDKWKSKNALCKAYKLYHEKKMSYLKTSTIDLYKQLQDIQYAIAYVLCEYFDFNYEFYYDNFPSSYKWCIAYDYIRYYDECKEAYENIIKENNTNNTINCDYIAQHTKDYIKGDVIYNMENGCLYMYDGKNFVNMC